MKIGLVRHFKVKQPFPTGMRISAEDIAEWFRTYDEAEVEEGSTDLGGVEWKACYASDLPRAIYTAEKIYGGPIERMRELRELPAPKFRTSVKLPFLGWGLLIRFSYLINRQTRQDIKAAKTRINTVLDQAESQNDGHVLIVSHGALMAYMRKELIRRGFRGPKFALAENGKLYIFENR